MSDATLNVVGTTEEAQRAIDKLTRKVAQLTEQLRAMKQESAKAGAVSKQDLGEQLGGLEKIGSSLLTVSALVGAATKVYGQWRADTDKLVDSHRKLVAELVKAATLTGTPGGQVSEAVKGLKGATAQQGIEAFLGISAAATGLSFERKKALTQELAPQGATGLDLKEASSIVGDFAEILKEKKPGDVVDIALKAQQIAGDKRGELSGESFNRLVKQLQQTGLTGEEAISTGLVSLTSDQNAKTIQGIAAAATAAPGHFGGATMKERRSKSKLEREFENLTPQQRRERLLSDPAMAKEILGKQALGAAEVKPEEIAGVLRQLREADVGEERTRRLAGLGTFAEGKAAQQEQLVKEAEGEAILGEGINAERARAREFIRAKSRKRGTVAGIAGRLETMMSGLGDITQGQDPARIEKELRGAESAGLLGKGDAQRFIDALDLSLIHI